MGVGKCFSSIENGQGSISPRQFCTLRGVFILEAILHRGVKRAILGRVNNSIPMDANPEVIVADPSKMIDVTSI